MMVEEISEGLKLAVSKGETLQQAMQSFYNTGYKKEDIESAARLLSVNVIPTAQPQESKIPQKQPILPQQQPFKPVQKVSDYGRPLPQQQPFKPVQKVLDYGRPLPQQQFPLPPKPVQKVSDYGQSQNQKNPKMIMIILVIILLIVFGGAIGWILFFKETVIEFFNRLVG